jgi:hypothetical protein
VGGVATHSPESDRLRRKLARLRERNAKRDEQVARLRERNATLREQNAKLREGNARLRDLTATLREDRRTLQEVRAWLAASTYDADGLAVWSKEVDFLRDPVFQRAYGRGIGSGHGFGAGADIHIEWRVHVACWAGSHAGRLAGDFVECGVNTGIYSLAICDYIDLNATGKSFFLFDTFDGIPETQMHERERERALEHNRTIYVDVYETARRNFEPFPRAKLIRGRVPDTLDQTPIDRVCYLSLDMNIAEPERAALEFFWDRLVPGAPVLLDDYAWAGHTLQKEQMDDFAASRKVEILTLPTGQGLLLKP